MTGQDLLRIDDCGLRCDAGAFHVDPARSVDCAIVTHAHIDHARRGCGCYVVSRSGAPIMRARLGRKIRMLPLEYGEAARLGGVSVSLHPAGHVLGSAQVRIESEGRVWVVTGDFKRDGDPSCEPFEVVKCDTLVTEATFGLPVYRWEPVAAVVEAIRAWWLGAPQRASILFCYAFGKTQRVLAELARLGDRPVYLHADAVRVTEVYRRAGITDGADRARGIGGEGAASAGRAHHRAAVGARDPLDAPFSRRADGLCLRVDAGRRPRGTLRAGFALSDHADWQQLVATVRETGARRVYVTHGESVTLARHLREALGIEAWPLAMLAREGGDA